MISIYGGVLDGQAAYDNIVLAYPRGTRLRRLIFTFQGGIAGIVETPVRPTMALFGFCIYGLQSLNQSIINASLSAGGILTGAHLLTQNRSVAGVGYQASSAPGVVHAGPGFPIEVPFDLVFGEEFGALQVTVGNLADLFTLGNWTMAVDVELPRTVNAKQIASPPVPVAKDEP